ncbi:IS30 family transposase [Sodalis ligni]|uniref:IS30 family transposase n=1 Tax=Sodalis ligni TaxID=2697027 RepID=UPI001BDEDAAB|nr:IS30 family transposase [Sodalis ligni]QWA09337.1 IS30 family transposase [Sodalis ligni]
MVSIHGAMTAERKSRIWQLWRKGTSMSVIARDIAKPPATVYSYLLYHGGMVPRRRTRRPGTLSMLERESISRGLACGMSYRALGRQLGRSASTVLREVNRNGEPDKYRACEAEKTFLKRSRRPKPFLLTIQPGLRSVVIERLEADWSPEQIAGWLKRQSPDGKIMCVSHETIYRSLFIQARGVLSEELKKHLRTKRMFRHARSHHAAVAGGIPDAISIRARPAEIEDRALPGHWEGDLIAGANNSAIATVVDRSTRFTVLCKVKNKRAESVVQSLTEQMRQLPSQLHKSLTWDRGQELSAHKRFSMDTHMSVYFCDPGCPWQRGTNENTNGLLRQYFPKGTSLAGYSQHELNDVAAKLNGRPRKTLGFKTPAEALDAMLQ